MANLIHPRPIGPRITPGFSSTFRPGFFVSANQICQTSDTAKYILLRINSGKKAQKWHPQWDSKEYGRGGIKHACAICQTPRRANRKIRTDSCGCVFSAHGRESDQFRDGTKLIIAEARRNRGPARGDRGSGGQSSDHANTDPSCCPRRVRPCLGSRGAGSPRHRDAKQTSRADC